MSDGYIVALGTFDGVHKGHRELISKAKSIADERNMQAMVVTFSNHPMEFLGRPPMLIMPHNRRIELLGQLCGKVLAIPFNGEMATMPPHDFVEMLITRGDMRGAVMGYNYTFGANASGDAMLMRELGIELGFSTDVVSPVSHGNRLVSSTLIRSLLEQGHIELANEMLCKPFCIEGMVVRNRRIGTTLLGYPTANIAKQPRQVLPKLGVYATITKHNGVAYHSVTNIGSNPTVGGDRVTIETHIIDFSKDIYDETLSIEFHSYIRPCVKFDSISELAQRIMVDIGVCRNYFAEHR